MLTLCFIFFLNCFIIICSELSPSFFNNLLRSCEYETDLNEELAQLLKIDFKRQGACGAEVLSEDCLSCYYSNYCVTGGVCCDRIKLKLKLLRNDETACPEKWNLECSTITARSLNVFQPLCICQQHLRCCSSVKSNEVATTRFYYWDYGRTTTQTKFD